MSILIFFAFAFVFLTGSIGSTETDCSSFGGRNNEEVLIFIPFPFTLGFRFCSLGPSFEVSTTAGSAKDLNIRDGILIVFLGFLCTLVFLPSNSPKSSSGLSKDTPVPTDDESSLFPFLEGGLKS